MPTTPRTRKGTPKKARGGRGSSTSATMNLQLIDGNEEEEATQNAPTGSPQQDDEGDVHESSEEEDKNKQHETREPEKPDTEQKNENSSNKTPLHEDGPIAEATMSTEKAVSKGIYSGTPTLPSVVDPNTLKLLKR